MLSIWLVNLPVLYLVLVSFILSSRDLVIGLLTLLVFLASAVLTLYRQAHKESRVSMTIMKGK